MQSKLSDCPPTTVILGDEIQALVDKTSAERGISKSEVIRNALKLFFITRGELPVIRGNTLKGTRL